MQKFLLITMLFGTLILAGCNANKVAVINSARIYQESSAGKAGLAYLESVEQQVRAKAEAAQKVAENMPNNEALPLSLQQFFASCQEAMNSAQQEAVTSVQDLIKKSIDNYRTQKDITIIMQSEAAVSVAPTADITEGVIAEMNKASISFKPVNIADFVAPAAPAAPAKAAPAKAKKSVKK